MSNIDIVRGFIGKWEAMDVDGIVDAFADTFVYHNIPMAPMTTKEEVRGFAEPFLASTTAVQWDVLFIAEDANGVVLTERVDAFVFGDKKLALPVMGTFELVDGKITKWRDYFDLQDFQNQMAAIQG